MSKYEVKGGVVTPNREVNWAKKGARAEQIATAVTNGSPFLCHGNERDECQRPTRAPETPAQNHPKAFKTL